MIVIRYPLLQQMHEHVNISPLDDCNTVLHYQLEEIQKKQIFVSVKDSNLRNIQGALVKMRLQNTRNDIEGLTDPDGVVEFSVLPNHTYSFVAEKKGFLGTPVDFAFTTDNHQSLKEVKLFMSQPSDLQNTMEVLVSSSTLRANQDYELHLFTAQYEEEEL